MFFKTCFKNLNLQVTGDHKICRVIFDLSFIQHLGLSDLTLNFFLSATISNQIYMACLLIHG